MGAAAAQPHALACAPERLAGSVQVGHAELESLLAREASAWRGWKSHRPKSALSSSRRANARPRWAHGTTAPPPTTTRIRSSESFSDDATLAELKEFIHDLNEDEQVSLVALAWIGRGSFGPDELDDALETAQAERTSRTADYLIGMPLLARLSGGGVGPARLFGRGRRGRCHGRLRPAQPLASAKPVLRRRGRRDRPLDRTPIRFAVSHHKRESFQIAFSAGCETG